MIQQLNTQGTSLGIKGYINFQWRRERERKRVSQSVSQYMSQSVIQLISQKNKKTKKWEVLKYSIIFNLC